MNRCWYTTYLVILSQLYFPGIYDQEMVLSPDTQWLLVQKTITHKFIMFFKTWVLQKIIN